ncbi:hypothetical protein vBBceSLY5_0029 [Bacillus phage vB_BceS_LY5]|nr:hypothetical protein vBBceSLY5_0029 [Bacillus phage vB_BceS_LY5]
MTVVLILAVVGWIVHLITARYANKNKLLQKILKNTLQNLKSSVI